MKKFILPFLIISTVAWSAPVLISPVPDEAKVIDQQLPNYRLKSKEVLGLSLRGGKIDYFYDKNKLIKARAELYGEMGSSSDDFYFKNGQIIFVCSSLNHFDKPNGKVVSHFENFYYFEDGKMVKWINGGKTMRPNSATFNNIQSNLLESAQQYIEVSKLNQTCVDLNGEKILPCHK